MTTGLDRLKIVELFGSVFLKLQDARRKETFHIPGGGGEGTRYFPWWGGAAQPLIP